MENNAPLDSAQRLAFETGRRARQNGLPFETSDPIRSFMLRQAWRHGWYTEDELLTAAPMFPFGGILQ